MRIDDVARAIRLERERLHLSASEVARRANVSPGTVTRLELGQIPAPRTDTLEAIGRVLGLSVGDLLDEHIGLPAFTPYLRAKYGYLPDYALAEIETFFDELRAKHGAGGPINREDEQ